MYKSCSLLVCPAWGTDRLVLMGISGASGEREREKEREKREERIKSYCCLNLSLPLTVWSDTPLDPDPTTLSLTVSGLTHTPSPVYSMTYSSVDINFVSPYWRGAEELGLVTVTTSSSQSS
jgi:hypothetical protein